MKKRWTKYLAVLCIIVCMFSLTGCNENNEKKKELTYSEETAKAVKKTFQGQLDAESVAEQLMGYYVTTYTASDRQTLQQQYDAMVDAGEEEEAEAKNLFSYLDATEDVGNYMNNFYNMELEMDDEAITLTGTMEYEEREVMFTCTLNMKDNEATVAFEKDLTIGEILSKAGMNTILGMGSVFLVLILISAIISCFKLIGKSNSKKDDNAVSAETTVAVPAVEEDVTDDLELIAVISAAIAAAEGTSTDSFVVRSIKRVNNAKWRNA